MTESEQLLGSVTTLQAGIDGFAVRTSARVIAIKTRLDTRAPTPPPGYLELQLFSFIVG